MVNNLFLVTPPPLYRKRASPLPKDDHSGGVKDSLLGNSSDPVEMRRLNYQTPGPSTQRCPNTPRMREHPPITVCDLADHIDRLKANDGLRFSQEYEVRLPPQPWTPVQLPATVSHNSPTGCELLVHLNARVCLRRMSVSPVTLGDYRSSVTLAYK
ncbi:receptor-type tyrosine-protein phosphatase F-like [Oncorhynchus masou masou]|uniref:receptor-type tyrosine-protein phosphatase F-like n=1 Tax=Oncorhynchus masou masou TaxID=90313 RepID=UPI003184370A